MHGGDTSTADDGNSSSMAKAFVSGPLLEENYTYIYFYTYKALMCVCVFSSSLSHVGGSRGAWLYGDWGNIVRSGILLGLYLS